MKLDSLKPSATPSGATVARDLEMFKQRVGLKRTELDRVRAELQDLVSQK